MQSDHPSLVQMEGPLLSGLLAEEIKRRTPNGLEIVYFANSGTEAVETAIKFARCATRRPTILYASKAFHGLTNGSLSLNGEPIFREGFAPFLPECRPVPFDDLEALEDALIKQDVAAFVVEPVQGKGVNIPTPGYLRTAAQLCRRHGALLVVDEVQCGMGRSGRFFAHEHAGEVDPDTIVLAKALSGGYVPVGAVLCRKWIYERVFSSMDRAVVHSSTFGQGSLAMVAGLATLRLMDETELIAHAARMGDRIGEALVAMQARYEFIHDVRWRGLMVSIEFGPPTFPWAAHCLGASPQDGSESVPTGDYHAANG
jgi:ornithine--oxo-acid transaminase